MSGMDTALALFFMTVPFLECCEAVNDRKREV